MAVSGLRSGALPLIHHHRLRSPLASPSLVKLSVPSKSKGFTLFARYAQTQDIFSSRRFQGFFFRFPLLAHNNLRKLSLKKKKNSIQLVYKLSLFLLFGHEV